MRLLCTRPCFTNPVNADFGLIVHVYVDLVVAAVRLAADSPRGILSRCLDRLSAPQRIR